MLSANLLTPSFCLARTKPGQNTTHIPRGMPTGPKSPSSSNFSNKTPRKPKGSYQIQPSALPEGYPGRQQIQRDPAHAIPSAEQGISWCISYGPTT